MSNAGAVHSTECMPWVETRGNSMNETPRELLATNSGWCFYFETTSEISLHFYKLGRQVSPRTRQLPVNGDASTAHVLLPRLHLVSKVYSVGALEHKTTMILSQCKRYYARLAKKIRARKNIKSMEAQPERCGSRSRGTRTRAKSR